MSLVLRPAFALLGTVVLAACGVVKGAPADAEGDAAYAAALSFAAGQVADDRSAVCVSVGREDAGERVLQEVAFRGTVLKGSQCEVSKDGAAVIDTGAPAVLLAALSLDRVSKDEVQVEVRYVRTSMLRGVRTYRVVRQSTAWVALGQIVKGMPF